MFLDIQNIRCYHLIHHRLNIHYMLIRDMLRRRRHLRLRPLHMFHHHRQRLLLIRLNRPRRRPRHSPHHWFTCVCIVHIDIHILANSSRLDRVTTTRSVSGMVSGSLVSRWGGRPCYGRGHSNRGSDRNRPSGAAERGGRRREGRSGEHGRGRRKKTRRPKRTNTLTLCIRDARNACLDANITAHRVSQPLAPRAGTEATGCHDSYSRRNCCGSGSRRNRWRYGPWATALARYSVALQAARALSGVQHTC